MEPAEIAVDAVATSARGRRGDASARWRRAIGRDPGESASLLSTAGRLTVNFHPDRVAASGRTVAEGLATTGRYESQWVTRISNGGRSAFPGGDRERWEHDLFAGAYDGADATATPHPIYGALDLLHDPHGGSPRFGSSYLVLDDRVRDRTTFCVGDSHAGPADLGTVDEPQGILAGLAEQAAKDRLLGRALGIAALRDALDGTLAVDAPGRELDTYVEAQIHGGVHLADDVAELVLDPSFSRTDTAEYLARASARFGFELSWHDGSELETAAIPGDSRGPTMPDLGRRVARPDGVVDAHAIGRAARSIVHGSMQPTRDAADSDAQQLKYLWHVVLALGHDAAGAPVS
jgi:hypothetical protein